MNKAKITWKTDKNILRFCLNIEMPKQEPKRTRSELDLSSASEIEMAGLTPSDREMLDRMHAQLQKLDKLDLLHDMISDIADLKKSVEFTNALIEDLKKENSSLKKTVNSLQAEVKHLTKSNKEMKNDILEIQCRSMQNNIVIMGFEEQETEDNSATENLVKTFMKENLKMTEAQVTEAVIDKTHRLGQEKDKEKPRPVVVRFLHAKSKDEVLGRGWNLKGTDFSMFQQYPREIVDRRRVLIPIMKEYKKKKQKARVVRDKLYINNQLFRDKNITTWL